MNLWDVVFILLRTRPSAVGYCVKSVKEEPNLEERVVPPETRYDPTRTHTHSRRKMCGVMPRLGVRKASWQRGSCKMRFRHVWSSGLSLARTLSLFLSARLETETQASNTPTYIYA